MSTDIIWLGVIAAIVLFGIVQGFRQERHEAVADEPARKMHTRAYGPVVAAPAEPVIRTYRPGGQVPSPPMEEAPMTLTEEQAFSAITARLGDVEADHA